MIIIIVIIFTLVRRPPPPLDGRVLDENVSWLYVSVGYICLVEYGDCMTDIVTNVSQYTFWENFSREASCVLFDRVIARLHDQQTKISGVTLKKKKRQ